MNTNIAPVFKDNEGHSNLQLFTAMRGGEVVGIFVVDHDQYLSATSYLVENPDVLNGEAFDFVRSATQDEFMEVFGELYRPQEEVVEDEAYGESGSFGNHESGS